MHDVLNNHPSALFEASPAKNHHAMVSVHCARANLSKTALCLYMYCRQSSFTSFLRQRVVENEWNVVTICVLLHIALVENVYLSGGAG